jgi:hypothetical protein
MNSPFVRSELLVAALIPGSLSDCHFWLLCSVPSLAPHLGSGEGGELVPRGPTAEMVSVCPTLRGPTRHRRTLGRNPNSSLSVLSNQSTRS